MTTLMDWNLLIALRDFLMVTRSENTGLHRRTMPRCATPLLAGRWPGEFTRPLVVLPFAQDFFLFEHRGTDKYRSPYIQATTTRP